MAFVRNINTSLWNHTNFEINDDTCDHASNYYYNKLLNTGNRKRTVVGSPPTKRKKAISQIGGQAVVRSVFLLYYSGNGYQFQSTTDCFVAISRWA